VASWNHCDATAPFPNHRRLNAALVVALLRVLVVAVSLSSLSCPKFRTARLRVDEVQRRMRDGTCPNNALFQIRQLRCSTYVRLCKLRMEDLRVKNLNVDLKLTPTDLLRVTPQGFNGCLQVLQMTFLQRQVNPHVDRNGQF
jgi:hypothetical protein